MRRDAKEVQGVGIENKLDCIGLIVVLSVYSGRSEKESQQNLLAINWNSVPSDTSIIKANGNECWP